LPEYFFLELQFLGRSFNDQICGGTVDEVRSSANLLQRAVAIRFGQLGALNSLFKIAFNRPDSASE
jgi:hypothetical protein